MKKLMLLAATASVALVGCVNDEKMEMTSEAQKISFDNPVMNTQTRAEVTGEIVGADYPDTEKFKVFAKQTDGDLTTWDDAEDFWTDAEEVSSPDGDGTNWYTETDYYWPRGNYKLSFAAYSPSDVTGVTYADATGFKVENFAVNGTVASQVDLMYAYQENCTGEVNGTSGVGLNFKHALSSVVFSAQNTNKNASYTITNVKVIGKFVTTATFTEKNTLTWEGTASTEDVTYTVYDNTTGVTLDAATTENNPENYITGKTSTAGATSALLPIPQDVPEDAKVVITYTETPSNGAKATTHEKEVKLKHFFKAGSTTETIGSWDVTNRYTYVFKFGETDKIFFVPKVSDWTNGGTVYATL